MFFSIQISRHLKNKTSNFKKLKRWTQVTFFAGSTTTTQKGRKPKEPFRLINHFTVREFPTSALYVASYFTISDRLLVGLGQFSQQLPARLWSLFFLVFLHLNVWQSGVAKSKKRARKRSWKTQFSRKTVLQHFLLVLWQFKLLPLNLRASFMWQGLLILVTAHRVEGNKFLEEDPFSARTNLSLHVESRA